MAIGVRGGSLGSLFVGIATDITDLDKGLREAELKTKRTAAQLQADTAKMERAFLGVAKSAGLVGIAIAALSLKAFIDFESAFAGVRKTVDASEAEFAQLEENFRNLSQEIPISAVQLAGIGEVAGQLGIRGVDNITKFTETIALLGVTTNISGEQAALQLSRFINILGESQDNVDRIGSSIVELGNNFAAQEGEILDLGLSLAAFGSQIGLSSDQVLAFSTIIKASGGESQAASTAFQKVALTLKDAVLTGSQDLVNFAEIAGITTEELSRLFKEDAAEAITVFIEGLGRIDAEGESVKQALEGIGLADQRLVREFGKVINSTDDLRRAFDLSSVAFEQNTALTEEAEKRFATIGSQLKVVFNRIVDLGIEIGENLIPTFQVMIGTIDTAVKSLQNFLDATRTVSKSLEEDLIRRIILVDEEIEKQRQIIENALGNASARQQAEQNINILLENRVRLMNTLNQIRQEAAATPSPIDGEGDAGGLDGDGEDPITAKQNEVEQIKQLEIGLSSFIEANRSALTQKIIDFRNKEFANDQEKAEAKKALEVQVAATALSSFENLLAKQAEGNKAAAFAFKAIQLGRSVINTSEAITEALPNIPLAILVGAIGAAEIATIVSTGFQTGTDSVPARLTPGEMVVPNTFADAIRKGRLTIGGPGAGGDATGGVTFENIEINVNGNLDEDAIPDIIRQIGLQTEAELRGA